MNQKQLIEVRSATLDDVIGIVFVQATTWLSDYVNTASGIEESDIREVDFQLKIRDWQHMVQSSSYQVLVASKPGGEIIGVLLARRDNDVQLIESLYVLSAYADSGYERELLLPALLWLEQGDGPIKARVVAYASRIIEAYAQVGFELFVEGDVDFIILPNGKNIPTIELIRRIDSLSKEAKMKPITNKDVVIKRQPKPRFVSRAKLALRAKLRDSTVKYYSEVGLLPFKQDQPRLGRRYELVASLKRLKQIRTMRQRGFSISEIRNQL